MGTFRIAPTEQVRMGPVSDQERQRGIAGPDCFVPFEKGDASDVTARGVAIGAVWTRDNPLVIDWSTEAVALLRSRAEVAGHRRPYFRNEHLWFQPGVAWNRVASYLRVRKVPANSIFSDKAPTIQSTVDWLDTDALLALLNSDTLEFILRTFLGSRMQLEIGDIRRLPVPVLSLDQSNQLSLLGVAAVAAKEERRHNDLAHVEAEVNGFVRDLYGIDRDTELWVVR